MVTIYALTVLRDGLPTARIYIGCTAGKLAKRMREHRCLLRNGDHSCDPLQEIYDTRPVSQSDVWAYVLEQVPKEQRRERELYWMEHFDSLGRLANEHKISFRPPLDAPAKAAAARVANGYRPSAESNEKRRLAQLGIPKGHGAKISATKRKRRDSLSTGEQQTSEAPDKEPTR
jgi:hypothetical protein